MTALVNLWNMALSQLGKGRVMDPAEAREPANACREAWPIVRDSTLRAHPWNCAIARASIGADADVPVYGYSYQYSLPNAPFCLRVLNMGTDGYPWAVEGRKLLTDASAPITIRYIMRVEDVGVWDPLLVMAAAAHLAHAVAPQLNSSKSDRDAMWKLYRDKLREARNMDGAEGTPADLNDDDWLNARN